MEVTHIHIRLKEWETRDIKKKMKKMMMIMMNDDKLMTSEKYIVT